MPVPERFRSAFSRSTLQTAEANASRFRVDDLLFFRGAHTATIIENERRTYNPVVVMDGARVVTTRCSCAPVMRLNDLCRHCAVLLGSATNESGSLLSEEFERSMWRAVAFASFSEGREIRVPPADPREQVLRRHTLTDQEQALLSRGSGSARLQFEASAWYRWSKSMFFDRSSLNVTLKRNDEGFVLAVASDAREDAVLVPLPSSAVEHVIQSAPEIVAASGFEIAPQSLAPSLRIEITRGRSLKLSPVFLSGGGAVLERAALPAYGRYFFSENRFASASPAPPMFAEKPRGGQSTLFELRPSAGIPHDRETVIDEDEVFAFVERHREELALLPETLAPDAVRNAKPVRLEGEVIFEFALAHRDLLEVAITFVTSGEQIAAADIARGRREGIRALIRGNLWIDIADPQFAWLDDATIGPNGRILVTKLELLRIRGSLRGTPVFRGDRACEQIFRLFDEIQTDSDAPSATSLGLDLYGYQQTGYQWLWLLQQNGFGGLLCDDMGLGKTHQAMALVRAVTKMDPSLAVLVVCPTSLLDHWREKLARYIPDVPVTVTTYGLVRSRIEQYRGKRFDLMVLDEMQTIKNADTATHHALRAIEKRIAVGLTGTPIENHEGELKALLEFVVPGYLPRHVDDRLTLQRLVRPFVLRRTKEQVLTELPAKIVDKRYCELSPEQRALYQEVLVSRAKPLRAQLQAGARVSYVHIFAALNYLKQICNHPASVGGGFGADAPSGKWDAFLELLDGCMTSGLKMVVFSQYLSMLSLIEDHLSRHGIGYASIKGATRDRGAAIDRFRNDPDCRVFTASLRAGGLGIDLTAASVVVHYDRWWNQAREDQATDRVHRLGQSKGVQVIKLITRGTIEEKIDALIASKGMLASDVIRADDPSLVKQFTKDELEELLS
jgi:superfamily II DNA or RNA helicase